MVTIFSKVIMFIWVRIRGGEGPLFLSHLCACIACVCGVVFVVAVIVLLSCYIVWGSL